jgi:hypothetical protein
MRPVLLLLMLLALVPAAGCTGSAPVASHARAPAASTRSASHEETARYAARERSAADLAKFEGGRGDTTTIIIVLLLVIIIVLIV